jgi:hypothetical protein
VLSEEIGEKPARDLTEDDREVLDLAAGKKKLFDVDKLMLYDLC